MGGQNILGNDQQQNSGAAGFGMQGGIGGFGGSGQGGLMGMNGGVPIGSAGGGESISMDGRGTIPAPVRAYDRVGTKRELITRFVNFC
jgi:hypothetical protein